MKNLFLFLVSLLALSNSFSQQKNLAEKLGYPKDAKLLIVHADDLGVAHSVNEASIEAFDKGGISSASIMVPCPWFLEIAAFAKQHPELDWGIHTTFTAEWKNYKWDAVLPANEVAGSIGPDGYLYSTVEAFAQHAIPAEVEKELRAQIERAQALGIKLSHIDNHMGSLLFTPSMLPVYFKVAKEFKLAMLAPRYMLQLYPPSVIATIDTSNVVFLDGLVMAPDTITSANWKAFYNKAIDNMKPGLTEIIVHLAYDDAEMKGVAIDHPDYGAAWRQRDFDYVTSDAFKKLLKQKGIIMVKWKDVQGVMYR